jgi:hypothetical protein
LKYFTGTLRCEINKTNLPPEEEATVTVKIRATKTVKRASNNKLVYIFLFILFRRLYLKTLIIDCSVYLGIN